MWNLNHGARSETFGANTGTTRGALVTASASANTFGAWASLGQTTFTWEMMTVQLVRASFINDYVVDIGIDDGSGNVFVIAPFLRLDGKQGSTNSDNGFGYMLPLNIPLGSRLVARASCAQATSRTIDVIVQGFSAGLMGAPGYSKMVALHPVATSRGLPVDPGGTAHTKTVVEVNAATSESVAAILLGIGTNADFARAAAASALFSLGLGAAGVEQYHIADIGLGWSTFWDSPMPTVYGPVPWYIPAGSRVVVAAQCSDNTAGDRTFDLSLWGFVQ